MFSPKTCSISTNFQGLVFYFRVVAAIPSSPMPGYREDSKLVKHQSLVYFISGRNMYSIYSGYVMEEG